MRFRVAVLGVAAGLAGSCLPSVGAAGAGTKVPHVHATKSHQYGVVGGRAPALPPLFRGAAMVRDPNGDEFVVGQQHVKGQHRVFRMVFLVHRHGAAHWREHARKVAAPPICKGTRYAAQLSPSGKHVMVEVASCDHVLYVVDTTTKRFGIAPSVRRVLTKDDFVDAAALPHNEVALLLRSPWEVGDGEPDVTTGSAKRGFAPLTELPPPSGEARPQTVLPDAIARDAKTGELTVLATGSPNTGVYAYTKPASGSWSAAITLAAEPMAPADDPIIGWDVAAARGRVTVWACRVPEYGTDPDDGDNWADPTCGTIDRTPSGRWGRLAKYPGNQDTFDSRWGGTLTVNPKTGSVHLVWLPMHDSAGGNFGITSGVKHVARVHGKWTTPKYLVRGDVQGPLSLALTAAGHPVVGYQLPHY